MQIITKILILLFIFFLPTQLGKHFFLPFSYLSGVRIDYLAPTVYLTDILAWLIIFLNFKTIFFSLKNNKFLLFLIFLGINVMVSLLPLITLYKIIKMIEMIGIGIVVSKTKIELKPILIVFFAGTVIQVVVATAQFVTKQSLQGVFYLLGERQFTLSTPDIAKMSLQGIEFLRPYGTFSHPNSMGGFYLVLYFFILTHQRISGYLKYALLLLTSLLVLLSFSKIVIFSYLLLNIAYLMQRQLWKACLFCFITRITMFIVVTGVFFFTQGDIFSVDKRLTVFTNAITIFITHPFFGVGLGSYLVAQHAFAIKYAYFFLQPVHNIFLLLLTEGGIVLTLYIGFIVAKVTKSLVKNQTFYYLCAAVVFTGMVDHYWLTLQQNILLLPLLYGLLRQKS